MAVIVTSSPIFPKGKDLAARICSMHPEVKTVVQNISRTMDKMMLGEQEKTLSGEGRIVDELMGLKFIISPSSFYQVNPIQTEKLYTQAIMAAELKGNETVLDCYCGIGTIGLCASQKAAQVIGVESNAAAVRDAVRNAKLNKIINTRFVTSDTGEFLKSFADSCETAQVAFLDPARAGCDRLALDSLIKIAPKKIVYISCNPETQARDCGVLAKAGYRIRRVQPVDMFPFTRHVETICLLSKLHADQHIEVELKMDELDLTVAESKATYEEIKNYVLEHSGLKVSSLYIAQVKQKCGIIERDNYNNPKSENAKHPQCSPKKEAAIRAALEHFKMI